MKPTIVRCWIAFFATLAVFALPCAAGAQGSVVNVADAPAATHAGSGAVVKFLATPNGQGTQSAFVAHLTVKAGGKVPEHRDATEEFLYVLSGKGTIWIDDARFEVKPGSLIYTPANAKVKFEAGPDQDVAVLQVFAPPGPEKKYATWSVADKAK